MTRTYGYTVYHDEPEDAGTDAQGRHGFASRREAREAAEAAMSDYWNGGATIEVGIFHPGEFGVRPDHWEFVETLAYIGPKAVAL